MKKGGKHGGLVHIALFILWFLPFINSTGKDTLLLSKMIFNQSSTFFLEVSPIKADSELKKEDIY